MITFKTIRWKNFLSTGNVFTEVTLNSHTSTLIVGINGAGKSTILDALTFVLFGKPFRKINKTSLVNTVNNKDCVVEIEFDSAGHEWKIIRGMKPNIFQIFCDGTLINQDSDMKDYQAYLSKSVLKMIFKSFTSIVILGSATFTPFMQLEAKDRRAIIEDLLDIQIFSTMNTLVKQKYIKNKEDTEKARLAWKVKSEKLEFIKKTLASLQVDSAEKVEQLKKACAEIDLQKQVYIAENMRLRGAIDVMDIGLDETFSTLTARHRELIMAQSKIQTTKDKHEEEIDFFKDHDSCPTCQQSIDTNFKIDRVAALSLQCLSAEAAIEDTTRLIDECIKDIYNIDKVRKQRAGMQNEIQTNTLLVKNADLEIKRLYEQFSKLKKQSSTIEDTEAERDKVAHEVAELFLTISALTEERQYIETAITLLKDDGIKTRINRQYLPIINKYMNKYLTQLGFFVKFELDENFEETIKSRYIDDRTYNSFSEGEKLRIDLAILFTWRAIAKMRNSVNVNILFMDEILDRSLDTEGLDEFVKMVWGLGVSDTNFAVISHRDQIPDKFERILRFDKRKGFSCIDV